MVSKSKLTTDKPGAVLPQKGFSIPSIGVVSGTSQRITVHHLCNGWTFQFHPPECLVILSTLWWPGPCLWPCASLGWSLPLLRLVVISWHPFVTPRECNLLNSPMKSNTQVGFQATWDFLPQLQPAADWLPCQAEAVLAKTVLLGICAICVNCIATVSSKKISMQVWTLYKLMVSKETSFIQSQETKDPYVASRSCICLWQVNMWPFRRLFIQWWVILSASKDIVHTSWM